MRLLDVLKSFFDDPPSGLPERLQRVSLDPKYLALHMQGAHKPAKDTEVAGLRTTVMQ